jgi:hypothetical protein
MPINFLKISICLASEVVWQQQQQVQEKTVHNFSHFL